MTTKIASLTAGEAVMRMDLANLPAIMFHKAAHGGLNMIYRRDDTSCRLGGPAKSFVNEIAPKNAFGVGSLMEIVDLLTPDSIVPSLKATCKKQALQELSQRGADATGIDDRRIFEVLRERERLGTTGVGRGVAIPHGKLSELSDLRGVFARLEEPIDFEAIDDEPVDLMFLLLAPEDVGADHLKALARVSRLLRDRAMCDKLRGSESRDALYALLTDTTSSKAA